MASRSHIVTNIIKNAQFTSSSKMSFTNLLNVSAFMQDKLFTIFIIRIKWLELALFLLFIVAQKSKQVDLSH